MLDDIFVYPRLTCWSAEDLLNTQKKGTPVASKEVVEHFRNSPRVLVSGADDSGKTSLLKKLYLDLSGDFAPIVIEATSLEGRLSEHRFINVIRKAIEEQYDSANVERYLQMEPSRKLLLVDDFHKSNLTQKNEAKFIEFAQSMFGHIIFTVSDFYRIREMVRLGTHEDAFRDFQRCDLREFGHALRAKLIRKWLSIGKTTALELETLDREVAAAEKTVTSLLGKSVVPRYPFNILTIVQMIESSHGHSTVATSFGHLYETLIKASLSFADAGGLQAAETKFNYLGMVAYRMFQQNSPALTEPELREVLAEYMSRFQMSADFHQTLAALRNAGVLEAIDGNYQFRYQHFYYYFVAKYLDRGIRRNDGRSRGLREQISYLSDRLHNEEYANIVLFYVHLSHDRELVLHILDNASRIYAEYGLCDFAGDVEFVNRLYKEGPKPLLLSVADVDKHQEEYRERMDESEEDEQPPMSLDAKVSYADDLADIHKVNISFKTLQVLGQVLRSAVGSLEGDQKMQII